MEQIEQAFRAGDTANARAGLKILVQQKPTPLAQQRYGRMLVEGIGGPPDIGAGMAMLERAAASGQLQAMTLMARVFLSPGPSRDPGRAAELLRSAATRGEREAKFYLAQLLLAGDGVAVDSDAGFSWMLAAAEDGVALAMLPLSELYARGVGTSANPAAAREWVQNAAELDVPQAVYSVASELLEQGNQAQQAAQFLGRSAQAGHVPSQRTLGTMLLFGRDEVAKDAVGAELWLTRAAEAGDVSAMHNLGLGYLAGDVLRKDEQAAANWFERASDRGLARSTYAFGRMLEVGSGRAADPHAAQRAMVLAAKQGSEQASLHLGQQALAGTLATPIPPHDATQFVSALLGTDLSEDARIWLEKYATNRVRPAQAALGAWLLDQPGQGAEAERFLTDAAKAGHVPSQVRLGQAFATGTGVPLDYVAAHTWLNTAAGSGHSEAATIRDTLTAVMTPRQIAEAQDRTRAYFNRARTEPPVTGTDK